MERHSQGVILRYWVHRHDATQFRNLPRYCCTFHLSKLRQPSSRCTTRITVPYTCSLSVGFQIAGGDGEKALEMIQNPDALQEHPEIVKLFGEGGGEGEDES